MPKSVKVKIPAKYGHTTSGGHGIAGPKRKLTKKQQEGKSLSYLNTASGNRKKAQEEFKKTRKTRKANTTKTRKGM